MGLSRGMERNTPCHRRREGWRWGKKAGLMLIKPPVLTPQPCVMTKGRNPGGQERPARCQLLHGYHASAGARQGSGMASAIIPASLLQPPAWMQPSPARSPATQIQSSSQTQYPTVKFTGSKALCGGCHVQAISAWMVQSLPAKGSCRASALQRRPRPSLPGKPMSAGPQIRWALQSRRDIEVRQASREREPLPRHMGMCSSVHVEKV